MKVKVIDLDGDFEDFEIEKDSEMEVELKLIDWYLECGSFEETIEMIEDKKNVKIEIIEEVIECDR